MDKIASGLEIKKICLRAESKIIGLWGLNLVFSYLYVSIAKCMLSSVKCEVLLVKYQEQNNEVKLAHTTYTYTYTHTSQKLSMH